jgi:hypothetical protein
MQRITVMLLRLAQRAVREHSSHGVVIRRFVGRQAESLPTLLPLSLLSAACGAKVPVAYAKFPRHPEL